MILFILISCNSRKLTEVTLEDFEKFVEATSYITDAEKYGWSIVQTDVYNFEILYGIDWRCPNGLNKPSNKNPVTQVSYNDALAYAQWKNGTLPTYQEYWEAVNPDSKVINSTSTEIFNVGITNTIGNVWEITQVDNLGRVRLAGGSYLCAINSCNGTSAQRELYVDQITGNSHIGFAIFLD